MHMKEYSSSQTQMRKGMLEFCTLLIIGKGQVYTPEILAELKNVDLLVVEGTLYPLLSRLRIQGALNYTWEESKSGPPRKYYSLTAQGKKDLEAMKHSWKELSASINTLLK